MSNWYKTALKNNHNIDLREKQNIDDNTLDDYYENYRDLISDQVRDFNKSEIGDRQPWRLIPAERLSKIWKDSAKMGFVRDIKGLQMIEDIIIENIKKIEVNTMLMEHSEIKPDSYLEEIGAEPINETKERFYGDWAVDNKGAFRISDYALDALTNGALLLMQANSPEEKLVIIDRILNVVHQRSNLAEWFIEGGNRALYELSNQEI